MKFRHLEYFVAAGRSIELSRMALRSLPRYDHEQRSEDRPVRPITRPRALDSGRFDWEGWKDPTTDGWLRTCAIITGEPNEFVREIHTRMPVILPEEHHDAWLSGEAGKEVLVPYPTEQ
jgi:SOS response associated peptidase (SRAP)